MVQVKFDCQSDHRAEDTSSDCAPCRPQPMLGVWWGSGTHISHAASVSIQVES